MEKKIRVFLADTSQDYLRMLCQALDGEPDMEVVGTADNGGEAWARLSEELPDVLVTDLLLPVLDGLSLIRELRAQGRLPHTVVLSAFVNLHMASELSRLGADDYLQKPCRLDRIVRSIRDTMAPEAPQSVQDYKSLICMDLKHFGVAPHLHGYHYLVLAIQMTIDDASLLRGITKSLYPAIARLERTQPGCVERSIRGAIAQAWLRYTPEHRHLHFGSLFDGFDHAPSNARFIALIAEHIETEFLQEDLWACK